jgi:KDO2-lipid IV(A) lauroyltransferase
MWWHPFKRMLHLMPITTAYGLGTILARLVASLPLPLKKAMERAAAIVLGPDATQADTRAAAREGMFCFLMNEIEVLLFPRFSAADMDTIIPVEGRNHLDAALAQGNGAILLICHFGANQMLMPGIGFRGYTLYQVSAPATILNERLPETRPQWLKRTRELRREHEQALPVHHVNGLGNLVEALECLKLGHTLAIAGDGGSFSEPVTIPFFGRTAHFPAGAVKIGLRFNSPILPVFIIRQPSGFNRMIIEPPLASIRECTTKKSAAVTAGVQEFAKRIEQYARAHPGHYLRHLAFREHMASVDTIPFWAD